MINIYDTTLRDGTQRKGISLSCDDKLRIAHKLDELGIDFIEGGWPGSNPKDAEFFERAKKEHWQHALICAFGATCKAQGNPEGDANIKALLDAETPICTVVGKTWTLHVTEVLRTTLEDNLRIIEQSLAYLRQQGRRVFYDAEHFFDGYKADPHYAVETLKAAVRGGAEVLVLCETNGGCLPWEIADIVRQVKAEVNHPLGIHCHNDTECAVANSLAAVREGAIQIQGTINGFGERCGNANLCSIIPNLELKLDMRCLSQGKLADLFEVSHFVTEVANLVPDDHIPYVGKSAFEHKGGIHVAAMRRSQLSYQHVDPALVGNQMRVAVSELSGRGNLLSKAEELGLKLSGQEDVVGVLNSIKELESEGFSFEAAEASVVLMIKRTQPDYRAPFELMDFAVIVEHREGRGFFAEATVKVRVGDDILHTASDGNGPVNALDGALRKALVGHHPEITDYHLTDYKVRILDGKNGTAAKTRVLIDTQSDSKQWSTVGAGENIIIASWQALADSYEYGLMLNQVTPKAG